MGLSVRKEARKTCEQHVRVGALSVVEASIDMNECAHISREDVQASARGAKFRHARRRIDPRISLFVLLIMNVAAFAASSLALEIAAVAFDAVLMLYLKRPRLMLGWLAAFVLILGIYFACVTAGPFFMPVSTCFLTFFASFRVRCSLRL